MYTYRKNSGFTIVELLIVVVIIGILAAITILAYAGISQRATIASLNSDLDNAAKRLKLDQVDLGAYPTATTTANNGAGLKASPGTTYQYSVDNSVSPQTFCLTATNGPTSYYITEDGVPTSGNCSGHIPGGAEIITNLVDNPSLESSMSGWSVSNVANISGSRVQVAGEWVYQSSRLTTSAAAVRLSYGGITVIGTETYTASILVTSSVNQTVRLDVRTPPGTTPIFSTSYPLTANVPQRLYTTGIPNISSVYIALLFDPAGAIGDTLILDDAMLTLGSSTYNYADGSYSGWSWTGTPHLSTSSGPAL